VNSARLYIFHPVNCYSSPVVDTGWKGRGTVSCASFLGRYSACICARQLKSIHFVVVVEISRLRRPCSPNFGRVLPA